MAVEWGEGKKKGKKGGKKAVLDWLEGGVS